MQFERVLTTFGGYFDRENIRYSLIGGLAMKNFPHRALYEGEDVRVLLKLPGVDRAVIRDYFEKQCLLEQFDAIERSS